MKARLRPELLRLITGKLETRGYLGDKEVESIALRMHIPSSRVYGFASQFDEFPLRPYRVRLGVCTGPACADAGGWAILRDLEERVPGGVLVAGEPGILRRHRSPAVCVESPKRGTWLAEGLEPSGVDALIAAVEKDDFAAYEPLHGLEPSPPQALSGVEPPPWSASSGGNLPAGWGPDTVAWAREHAHEVGEMLARSGVADGTWKEGGGKTAVLVCDTVGVAGENSVDFAAFLINPRAVVAGAAMAAAACGAGEIVFYLPWNEPEVGETCEKAADELLSGVGIRHTVCRGPAHVPCTADIGMAALLRGMMLWNAASRYGWGDARGGEVPPAVLPAEAAWRLPWIAEGEAVGREWASSRLLCLNGIGGAPRLLEVAPDAEWRQVIAGAGVETGGGGFKAVHLAGLYGGDVVAPWDEAGAVAGGGEAVMLDALTCMVRWALYLARQAERGCCGGCAPGRTAPAAVAGILRAVLIGEAEETGLTELTSLLETAGKLALCPRLEEILKPISSCVQSFREEFEAHAADGTCRAGSCAPAVEAAT